MMSWSGSVVVIWQVTLLWLAELAFWVLIVGFVYGRVRRVSRALPDPASPPAALRTLEERLARGEIDVREFQRRRDAQRAVGSSLSGRRRRRTRGTASPTTR